MSVATVGTARRPLALVMGVANHRSIAWACVQEFLARDTDCLVTYHPRFAKHVERLVTQQEQQQHDKSRGQIVGHFPCRVETDIPHLFQSQIPQLLLAQQDNEKPAFQEQQEQSTTTTTPRSLNAIVHSVAFADMEHTPSLGQATWEAYAQAMHISSYSLVETARSALPLLSQDASLTALSYIGAVRALRSYHIMGPAKAALEANVRGLAAEYGYYHHYHYHHDNDNDRDDPAARSLRVNAVSAGPVATLSSRGIRNFGQFSKQVAAASPLRRHVTPHEIATTVHFVALHASGMTGQTVYVDAGYSSVVPVLPE